MAKAILQLLVDKQILNKYKSICHEAGIELEIAFEASMRSVIEKWDTDTDFKENWLKPYRRTK